MMLFLLSALASAAAPLSYQEARALAFQTPYALDAERRGVRVDARAGQRDGDGWTFRLFARNCAARSCLVGWVRVDTVTGAITDPVAERPIRSAHLAAILGCYQAAARSEPQR